MPLPAPVIVFQGSVTDQPLTAKLDDLGTHTPTVGNTVVLLAYANGLDTSANLNEWSQLNTIRIVTCLWKVWGLGDTVGELVCSDTGSSSCSWIAYELSGAAHPTIPQLPSPDPMYESAFPPNVPGDQYNDDAGSGGPSPIDLGPIAITPTVSNEIVFAAIFARPAGTGPITWTNGFVGAGFVPTNVPAFPPFGAITAASFSPAVAGTPYSTVMTWAGAGTTSEDAALISFMPGSTTPPLDPTIPQPFPPTGTQARISGKRTTYFPLRAAVSKV